MQLGTPWPKRGFITASHSSQRHTAAIPSAPVTDNREEPSRVHPFPTLCLLLKHRNLFSSLSPGSPPLSTELLSSPLRPSSSFRSNVPPALSRGSEAFRSPGMPPVFKPHRLQDSNLEQSWHSTIRHDKADPGLASHPPQGPRPTGQDSASTTVCHLSPLANSSAPNNNSSPDTGSFGSQASRLESLKSASMHLACATCHGADENARPRSAAPDNKALLHV